MIWESNSYRKELLRIASRLAKRQSQARWSEPSRARVEMDVFISAFLLRRLIESKKVPDRIASHPFALVRYPCRGKPVTLLNWHRIWELYDFRKPQRIKRDTRFVSNQLIHSYVFATEHKSAGRGGLQNLIFCSDWERRKWLYELSVAKFVRFLVSAGKSRVVTSDAVWDEKRGDYDARLMGASDERS